MWIHSSASATPQRSSSRLCCRLDRASVQSFPFRLGDHPPEFGEVGSVQDMATNPILKFVAAPRYRIPSPVKPIRTIIVAVRIRRERPVGNPTDRVNCPVWQNKGIRPAVQFVNDLLAGHDPALRSQKPFLLHSHDAPKEP